ncbi:MAG: FAD:protein FMN transferase [Ruminococcus sp.]|nr:FAD:protein FMN transferase [Ruminococcus sp.]
MKLLRKSCILIMTAAVILTSGCSLESKYDCEFFAMDTVMTINAYGSKSESAVKAAQNEISRLDSLLSVQSETSEIFKLNQSKEMTVSEDTLTLITRSKEIYTLTDGAFDISCEPLTREWGFYSGLENRVPSQQAIENALKGVGAAHIKIKDSTITLDENTSLDLGGIAKGYASQKAAEILKENGVNSALMSLGGNVRAVGSKPDGENWSVAITDPDDNSKSIGTLKISDKAVVTSGGYQRYFEENGQIYHHIIDTKTGYPADSGLKSVTIVSSDDTLADALSTSLFVMGLEKSGEFYSENSSLFGAVFITDKGEIYVTDNLKDSFMSEQGFEVIAV